MYIDNLNIIIASMDIVIFNHLREIGEMTNNFEYRDFVHVSLKIEKEYENIDINFDIVK